MNGPNSRHEALKRRWDKKSGLSSSSTSIYTRFPSGMGAKAMAPQAPAASVPHTLLGFSTLEDDMASTVVPPVTVVLEGRSICHRIHLHKHASYESLAMALRRIFVDAEGDDSGGENGANGFDLSNAVPGYLVAYEDMEDDLLLAGDLSWKDFVRVAKRIRIIPAKPSHRKNCGGA